MLFIFFALVISSDLCAQAFEGKIIYKNSYKSKLSNVTDQQFNAMMGDRQEYFIKGGEYKSVTNGTFFMWQLYLNEENKLYSKMANSEAILWNDGSINKDEIVKTELNKEVIEVLGYRCDELILTCKSGIQKYYFNSKFSLDSKLFSKHLYGNWYEFISRSNALPLKSIIDNSQFILESVATEIIPMQLDKIIFALPPNAKTTKSPY
jgi:hypothetical protein